MSAEKNEQTQIAIQKRKIFNLKDESELDEVTIDIQREANIASAD